MINTAFVHTLDDDYITESAYKQNAQDINQIIFGMELLVRQNADLKAFDLFTEAKEEFFMESIKESVTKLGDKIIQIFSDLKERITGMFGKFRENDWKKKDNDKKIEMIAKRDPKTAERVQIALERGDLDMNDFKDIKTFFEECDKVLDDLEKKAIDPKSIRGRWEKAKKKVSDNKDNIRIVCTVIGAVATAGTFYFKYNQYKENKQKALVKESEQIEKLADKERKRITNRIKVLKAMSRDSDTTAVTESAILAQMANEISRMEDINVRKRLNLHAKITNKIFSAMLKLSGKSPEQYRDKKIEDLIDRETKEGERLSRVAKTHRQYAPKDKKRGRGKGGASS